MVTATGNQPYTTARVDYLASYLQGQLPGLDHDLAVKWINAERGVNGNVLGVTYDSSSSAGYQGKLQTYSSQEQGLDAAAALVKSSGNYAGIRASLDKDYTTQAQAIVASPWNVRNSAYYARLFGIGTLSGTPTQSSIGSGTLVQVGGRGSTLGAWDFGNGPIVSFPEGKVITGTDVQVMTDALIKAGIVDNATGQALIRPILATEIGQPWNKAMQERLQQKFYARAGTMPTDIGGALGSIGDAIVPQPLKDAAKVAGDIGAFLFDVDNWKYLGALVVGVPLALIGFYLLAGVQTGGQNA
jgi:hypothetical protein